MVLCPVRFTVSKSFSVCPSARPKSLITHSSDSQTANQLSSLQLLFHSYSIRIPESYKEEKRVEISCSPCSLGQPLASTWKVLRVWRTKHSPRTAPSNSFLGFRVCLFYLARDSLLISWFVFQEKFYMGAN